MSSTNQAHTRHESEGNREFSFWGSSNTIASENDCNHLGGNEASLNKFKFEHSPFLPGGSSDPSQSKAIAEGRRELMEMMEDMSESSYELSLQDMVVEQKVPQPQPDQNENSVDNTLMQSSSNKTLKKKKKKKSKSGNRPDRIMRVESMESETFLLKMFFPSSLDWMKKAKVQNVSNSKVSQSSPLKESIKQVGKEWRIKRFFLADNSRGNIEDGLSQNKSRYVDRSFSFPHGCWPFFHHMKSKAKKLGGLID